MTADDFGAGWYPDGEPGWERWWDGAAWTGHRRETRAADVPPPPLEPPPPAVPPPPATWAAPDRRPATSSLSPSPWPGGTQESGDGPAEGRGGRDALTGHTGRVAPGSTVGPVGGWDGRGGGTGGVLAGMASIHGRQRGWSPWLRVGWWTVLIPLAVACWAAGLAPGWFRPAGFGLAGVVAVVYLAALSPAVGDGGSEDLATDIGAGGDAPAGSSTSVTTTTVPTTVTMAATTSTAPAVGASSVGVQPLAGAAGEPPATPAPTTTAPPPTPPPTTVAVPAATAAPPPTTAAASGCHPAYSPCLPDLPGDAINCGDLAGSQKPVTVHDPDVDPYGLDGNDHDGRGCESG